MHYSSQGWSVVADQRDRARWKEFNRPTTPADQWWCVIGLYMTKKVSYQWEMKVKELKHRYQNTYSVIRDFVLGVDHATVRESQSA